MTMKNLAATLRLKVMFIMTIRILRICNSEHNAGLFQDALFFGWNLSSALTIDCLALWRYLTIQAIFSQHKRNFVPWWRCHRGRVCPLKNFPEQNFPRKITPTVHGMIWLMTNTFSNSKLLQFHEKLIILPKLATLSKEVVAASNIWKFSKIWKNELKNWHFRHCVHKFAKILTDQPAFSFENGIKSKYARWLFFVPVVLKIEFPRIILSWNIF